MADILLKNIPENIRKGFKVACAAVDETMRDMVQALMGSGCDYDDHRKFIDMVVRGSAKSMKKHIDAKLSTTAYTVEREDIIEALYSATLFCEVYLWKIARDVNLPRSESEAGTSNIAKWPDFGEMLVRITEIKKYLLEVSP